MLTILLILRLLSNSITLRRDKSIIFSRATTIILIISSIITYDNLYLLYLKKGIVIFVSLFNFYCTTNVKHIFIVLLGSIILLLTSFYSRKGGLSSCFILLSTSLLYAISSTTNLDNLYTITSISNVSEDTMTSLLYWYKSYYIHISLLFMTVYLLFKFSAGSYVFWWNEIPVPHKFGSFPLLSGSNSPNNSPSPTSPYSGEGKGKGKATEVEDDLPKTEYPEDFDPDYDVSISKGKGKGKAIEVEDDLPKTEPEEEIYNTDEEYPDTAQAIRNSLKETQTPIYKGESSKADPAETIRHIKALDLTRDYKELKKHTKGAAKAHNELMELLGSDSLTEAEKKDLKNDIDEQKEVHNVVNNMQFEAQDHLIEHGVILAAADEEEDSGSDYDVESESDSEFDRSEQSDDQDNNPSHEERRSHKRKHSDSSDEQDKGIHKNVVSNINKQNLPIIMCFSPLRFIMPLIHLITPILSLAILFIHIYMYDIHFIIPYINLNISDFISTLLVIQVINITRKLFKTYGVLKPYIKIGNYKVILISICITVVANLLLCVIHGEICYCYIYPVLSLSLAITIFCFERITPFIVLFGKKIILSAAIYSGYTFMYLVAILTSVISAVYNLANIKQIFFHISDYIVNPRFKKLNLGGLVTGKDHIIDKVKLIFKNIIVSSSLILYISIIAFIIGLLIFIPQEWLSVANLLALILFNF